LGALSFGRDQHARSFGYGRHDPAGQPEYGRLVARAVRSAPPVVRNEGPTLLNGTSWGGLILVVVSARGSSSGISDRRVIGTVCMG
jgi:hypothetical protein